MAQFSLALRPSRVRLVPMGRTPVWQGKLEFGADFEAHHLSRFTRQTPPPDFIGHANKSTPSFIVQTWTHQPR